MWNLNLLLVLVLGVLVWAVLFLGDESGGGTGPTTPPPAAPPGLWMLITSYLP